jgi:hypothetical protein
MSSGGDPGVRAERRACDRIKAASAAGSARPEDRKKAGSRSCRSSGGEFRYLGLNPKDLGLQRLKLWREDRDLRLEGNPLSR